MNKRVFLTVSALMMCVGQAHASNLQLPVGICRLAVPERGFCGDFRVRSNRSMSYIGGDCNQAGKILNVTYRAKKITMSGNDITIDKKFHVTVMWIDADRRKVRVKWSYVDKYGEDHSGRRELACR